MTTIKQGTNYQKENIYINVHEIKYLYGNKHTDINGFKDTMPYIFLYSFRVNH